MTANNDEKLKYLLNFINIVEECLTNKPKKLDAVNAILITANERK
jgi:hypothetical protein